MVDILIICCSNFELEQHIEWETWGSDTRKVLVFPFFGCDFCGRWGRGREIHVEIYIAKSFFHAVNSGMFMHWLAFEYQHFYMSQRINHPGAPAVFLYRFQFFVRQLGRRFPHCPSLRCNYVAELWMFLISLNYWNEIVSSLFLF